MKQLPLPITPADMLNKVVRPALKYLPDAMSSERALVMLVALPGQESNLAHRWQVIDLNRPEVRGPARGLYQFELGKKDTGAGVWGVFEHSSSRYWLSQVCAAMGVEFAPRSIWLALETNDLLAVCVARLLLFTDPKPLPPIPDPEAAFQYYLRNWRPGAWTNGTAAARAKLRAKWGGHYGRAYNAVRGSLAPERKP